ncbi:MAG TPA: hypothetical protein VLK22_03920 [Candidatus Udaeobacter sp.]|nr:hypothetical protein [Candidatus Udaeobacter sp.]
MPEKELAASSSHIRANRSSTIDQCFRADGAFGFGMGVIDVTCYCHAIRCPEKEACEDPWNGNRGNSWQGRFFLSSDSFACLHDGFPPVVKNNCAEAVIVVS